MISTLKAWARALENQTMVLYFAARDPRTPLRPKLIALLVVAYALSPIDLIPDFIPVLGYLDDLLILPLGIALALKRIPAPVLEEARMRARAATQRPRRHYAAAAVIIAFWLGLAAITGALIYRHRPV